VDRVADWLPSWMVHLLTREGRLILTKVTLTYLVIYPAIALQLPLGQSTNCAGPSCGEVQQRSVVGTVSSRGPRSVGLNSLEV
jgi:hypothetical protein